MRFFFYIGLVFSFAGLIPILRFMFYYFIGEGAGKVQSLIVGGALLNIGIMIFIAGLLADLIAQNRQLNEISLAKIRALELREHQPINKTAASDDETDG